MPCICQPFEPIHIPLRRTQGAKRRALEETLLPQYQAALAASGVEDYSLEDCRRDYQLAVFDHIKRFIGQPRITFLKSTIDAFEAWECEALLEE